MLNQVLAVAYRLNVPAGYAEDSYNGHVTAVAGDVPATFSNSPSNSSKTTATQFIQHNQVNHMVK